MNSKIKIEILPYNFTICKTTDLSGADLNGEFFFISKTDEENSVVCITENAPHNTSARSDGWRAFRVKGVLDFSLVGILAEISAVLADNNIGIFAVSTYNTDYILTKEKDFYKAVNALKEYI